MGTTYKVFQAPSADGSRAGAEFDLDQNLAEPTLCCIAQTGERNKYLYEYRVTTKPAVGSFQQVCDE
jgi:hypothetical protein